MSGRDADDADDADAPGAPPPPPFSLTLPSPPPQRRLQLFQPISPFDVLLIETVKLLPRRVRLD